MTEHEAALVAQRSAEAWNSANDVGASVRYWTGLRSGGGAVSRTRTEASVLGGHTAVVWVEGEGSCIALTHIAPEFPIRDEDWEALSGT